MCVHAGTALPAMKRRRHRTGDGVRPAARVLAGLWLLGLAVAGSAGELVFTAPPREAPEAGHKLYAPLARHLSRLLGRPVRYEHPGNWRNYQRRMRNDRYDIVFDGPHFAAWRIAHLGHRVVVKLPGTLRFYLLVRAGDKQIRAPADLAGRTICSLPLPHLSTLSVLHRYRNPVRQPELKAVRGGMGMVYKAFAGGGDCDALVLRARYYHRNMNEAQRRRLRIIYRSPRLPDQVITVSRRLAPADSARMLESLTTGPGRTAAAGIVQRFGGRKVRGFVAARPEEYQGYNELLEGVVFGW